MEDEEAAARKQALAEKENAEPDEAQQPADILAAEEDADVIF